MANLHGKNAIVYISAGSGEAVEISEQNTYSIEADFELAETSELGDTWKTKVKGLMNWSGSLDGNFNTASNTLWSAFTADTPQKFYLYPTRSSATQYYYGTCWVKLGTILGGGTGDKAKSAVAFEGDGALSKN